MGETQAIKETREEEEDLPEPPKLRFLRRMVVALTATLMLGVLAIAAAIVITVSREPSPSPTLSAGDKLAEAIVLPEGEALISAALSGGVLTVATQADNGVETLRLFDAETGAPLGATVVKRD